VNIRPSDDEFIYSQFTLSLCNWMPRMEYRWTSRRLDHALSHAHRVQEFVDFEFEAFALARQRLRR
jgi:hypothetical protein